MSSPREREKRERRDSRGDKREGQGRKKNMNESEETEEFFNVLGFKDTSTLVGHFMLSPRASPREREKRDSRGDKREGQGIKKNKNESEETEEFFIVLGFKDTSTLVGHFVSSSREREKRDRRDSRRDEREGQRRKRNKNESEETEK